MARMFLLAFFFCFFNLFYYLFVNHSINNNHILFRILNILFWKIHVHNILNMVNYQEGKKSIHVKMEHGIAYE